MNRLMIVPKLSDDEREALRRECARPDGIVEYVPSSLPPQRAASYYPSSPGVRARSNRKRCSGQAQSMPLPEPLQTFWSMGAFFGN